MSDMRFFSFVVHDIKARFSGSRWGFLWALASPAVTIAIYWFVYTVALQGRDMEGVPYLHFLIAGILPWFFFAEGLTLTASVYRDYSFLVRNIRFPLEHLPSVRVTGALFLHGVLLILAYGVLILSGASVDLAQLWVFFWMAGGFLLTLGLGRIFALWNACCKDVAYGLNIAIQLGFWLTPIFWSPTALPDWAKTLVGWNPVALWVEGYRNALLFHIAPTFFDGLIFWCEILLVYGLSTVIMKKIRPTLADRV